jgi:hypothetical protein
MGFDDMQKVVLSDMFVCVHVPSKRDITHAKTTLNLFVCAQRAQFVICNL